MSYLPSSKFGKCALCGTDNVNCVKVKKELHCIPCHRGNKNTIQIQKANQRDRDRADATKKLKPKEKRKLRSGIESKVRGLGNSTANIETVNKQMSKSELMKEADRLFSLFIRNRDSDKEGWVVCPLCNKRYNIEQETYGGDKIIQNGHFIKREVYSLRYSEHNCKAICCYCNKNMFDYPATGTAYLSFKKLLISELGETEVVIMEVAHRKINMLEAQQLKNIIEHYGTN